MNEKLESNLVEIDRRFIVNMGGSLYILVPRALRQSGVEHGDEVIFLRSPSSTDTVIRIVKKSKDE